MFEPQDQDESPLKILIVSQYYWPEEFRINELAKGLVDRGHSVTVLTGLPNYPEGRIHANYSARGPWTEMHEGVRILRAPVVPRGAQNKLKLVLNYFSFAISASVIAWFRIRENYDAVFAYQISPVTVGYPAFVAARRAKAPVFLWVLDLWPESLSASGMVNSPFALKIAEWLARKVYAYSDVVLASSEGFGDPIRQIARSNREVKWFPQWENAATSSEIAIRSQDMPVLPTGFRLLFAGNIGASQDFETILAAAELLRDRHDIHWIIVGDGRKLAWVRNEVARRGLEQTFHCLGRFSSDLMPAFYAQSDALLITLRDEPTFALTVPAKLQSYLASGRPVVAAVNGEVMRIVEDNKAGRGVPAARPALLAEAVEEMAARDFEELSEMGRNGRKYFETNYDRDVLFDQLIGWFYDERRTRRSASLGS